MKVAELVFMYYKRAQKNDKIGLVIFAETEKKFRDISPVDDLPKTGGTKLNVLMATEENPYSGVRHLGRDHGISCTYIEAQSSSRKSPAD